MPSHPRRAAQQRADQIRAFREELDALRREQVTPLTREQEENLAGYHDRVLERLALEFDVDRTAHSGQLSRGLRLASFFGAVALVAAVTALIDRFWGDLTLPTQITLLTLFPLASLAGVQIAADRERTRYMASLLALVAFGTATVAVVMTARLLNIPFSALLFWPIAGFGVAVAMSYGFRWVFAVSLAILLMAVAGAFFAAGGVPWTVLFMRLEPLGGSALVLMVLAKYLASSGEGFEETARLTALLVLLGVLLLLATVSGFSLLPLTPDTAMIVYQVVMLATCLIVLGRRLRARDQAGVNLASAYLAVFLLIRSVDWVWEALPAYVFFLLLAGAAFTSIAVLRRMRARIESG